MAAGCRVNRRTRLGRITLGALSVVGLLALNLVSRPAVAKDREREQDRDQERGPASPCGQTSRHMLRSCKRGARDDFWLALAKCDNLSSSAERKACQQEASKDLKDALAQCSEQFASRQEVCQELGGGPYDPEIHPEDFVVKIDNPLFPLTPGTTFIYEGSEHDEFFVTHNTKEILGVTCTEIRDTVTVDDELVEDTLDWFAQDKDGNVWYFGENAKQLEGGLIVGVEGSWTGGVDGAKPGIIMKAPPKIGDFYRQEFSLDTAEDVALVLSLTESVTVPFGSFDNCVETKEFSPLEPSAVENKFYVSGVGLVLDVDLETGDRLELVEIKKE